MNIQDGVAAFKSQSPYYELERKGIKPSTIRVIDVDDLAEIARCTTIRIDQRQPDGTAASFVRDITGIFDLTPAMTASGLALEPTQRIVCICWDGGPR